MDSNKMEIIPMSSVPSMPTFEEDNFDLIEHKNAATATTQAKARVKRDRRKVSVGRIIVMLLAFIVCTLLYLMARNVAGLFGFF